jgi:hypothetical protein
MAPPRTVRVQGRKGSNATRLNGAYERRKGDVGNRPAYVKTTGDDDKMVIWFWAAKKVWMLTRQSMINTDSAYACVQEDSVDPTKISKPWRVFDKSVGTHKPDEKMVIIKETSATPRSPKAAQGKKTPKKPQELQQLQKEKKDLERKLEEMRKQIDGMEDQMTEYEEEIHRAEHDKYDQEQVVSFIEERIFKVTTDQHALKEKLTTVYGRFKKTQGELKENRESVASQSNPSFDSLINLKNPDSEVLLNCIFNVFEEQGVDFTLQNILSPSTTICDEITSIQENYS